MTTPTTTEMLDRTLKSISAATIKLDRDLGAIIRDAANARTALAHNVGRGANASVTILQR